MSVSDGFNIDSPLITIITVVFNGVDTLEQSILSVISQSQGNIEYIVIDGGSTDGTIDVLCKYDYAIDYWVSEPDNGIYDAWNKGVSLAMGEWISFLGADDCYIDGALSAYVDVIDSYRGSPLDYISSRVNLVTGCKVLRTIGQCWNWRDFQRYMNVAHVGSLHSRALFDRYGLYDTTYKICGDYEFLLRSRSNLRAAYMETVTVNMKVGGVSDGNFLVFDESARAKVTTGNRSFLMSYFEKISAIFRWKIRSLLWY